MGAIQGKHPMESMFMSHNTKTATKIGVGLKRPRQKRPNSHTMPARRRRNPRRQSIAACSGQTDEDALLPL